MSDDTTVYKPFKKFIWGAVLLLYFSAVSCLMITCYFLPAVPFLDKSQSLWTNRRIYCQVSQSNPLPTFKWQHQHGPCLNFNPECNPDKSRWSDLPASFVVSPPSDDATRKSTVAIPKDTQSGFFRCKATNREVSAENVMKFFVSGEL